MMRWMVVLFVFCGMLITDLAFGQTVLFEKKNLADWVFYVDKEGVNAEDVFSFSNDASLHCKGQPFGYLATKESYKNFKFSVEWCWSAGEKPTNSGIFLKITDQPQGAFLPKTVEVQLQHGSAGDLWAFHGRTLTESGNRIVNRESANIGKFMGVQKLLNAEKEPGQWNTMEILCADSLIVVVVNGNIVNWTTGAEAIEGRIGFQSEGGPIQFRNAIVTPLP